MMDTFMKIETIKKFPHSLPNDEESLIRVYPYKFPPINKYFEKQAEKFFNDPRGYTKYTYWAQEEMFAGFEVIKDTYEQGDQDDLAFLVDIDQQLSKLFCYRFWPVNYLFADGMWHEYFVENLKAFVRQFVDITDDIEDYEEQVLIVERDLMQTEYADLYLQQALGGIEIVNLLSKDNKVGKMFVNALENHDKMSKKELEKIWEKVGKYVISLREKAPKKIVYSKPAKTKEESIAREFLVPIGQVSMRGSMAPLYAFLTHVVEFNEENKALLRRHEDMKDRIKMWFDMAKANLSKEDYKFFERCYQQSRNLSIAKDTMGEIDPFYLPFWFGDIHSKIKTILAKTTDCDPKMGTGHGGMFSRIVWYLPGELQAKVMTPDKVPYKLKGNKKKLLEKSQAWNAWEHYRE